MSQDFHGGVGQAAAGDINNFGVSISLAGKAETRGLVSAQRNELHALRAKCEELGDDPRDVWRRVHAQLGVTTIGEINAEQFTEARDVIQARLEHLQDDADKRRLVGKVLRAVAEKDAKAEMNNFCELAFGRTQLNNLQKAQLQKTLEFIQRFEPNAQVAHPQGDVLTLKQFLVRHRQNAAALFFLGVLIGGIFF
ncbi:hypothetical protein [Pseudomonas fluorescens]|uniref:Uncharacterized protein n=1 Tax=Pseudomonas fluorescens TaxID=294 RepID=A0A944DP24_PSEFL|nr:hypothetical protein [Pseudomonas fluorescens]MBT2294530.1 hypothetical protein [Pseudomonas fluorescens]MBT2306814.1 hypothetical protein [Pseudomonas fluorescens]MBT2316276.1 hypothetical protein [Pseudomonas fluorescens]MBT2331613.1 hypothetical protein [Pseudomonas fluorescens]MBT2342781.1 hypothetical protein [Pseudomonas fluorescens]